MEGGLGLSLGNGLENPSTDDAELDAWVDKIIGENTKMNFVDRIARPELYPTMPHKKGMATHLMSWGNIEGKPAVFPSIIFDPTTQALKMLSMDQAFDHAIKTKEFIPFESEDEADLFSQQYKRHWRNGKGPKGYQP